MAGANDSYRALIDRYLTAYNRFDVAGMIGVLHPDVVFRNVSGGQVTAAARGRDEFRALAEQARALFRERRQTVTGYGENGDSAWITIDYEGTLASDFGPALRAGDTLRLVGRSTFMFRDGLIAELVDES
jgi:ketosteroid isomerase-like protein